MTIRVYHRFVVSLLILLFGLSKTSIAQKEAPPVFETRHKNVYVEALGSSILLGAHFDMRRFQPLRNGLTLQLTLTPLILQGVGLIPLNFGLGLGFGFK